jgi:DNA-binding MarR family transcriptional regulator
MKEQERVGHLTESLGYILKQSAKALHLATEEVLRPFDLTVAQYACLEQLGRHPGLSNAELGRGAFVSRQSMNLVLRGLQTRGLVTRPDTVETGWARPTQLTPDGRAQLHAAAESVRIVEKRMISAIPEKRRVKLRRDLAACAEAIAPPAR